jgi:hypothetical protein
MNVVSFCYLRIYAANPMNTTGTIISWYTGRKINLLWNPCVCRFTPEVT